MPEGDLIYKDARKLRPILVGHAVLPGSIGRHGSLAGLMGSTITHIHTHGKHLLVEFDAGIVIRVHRRMTGFWKLGPPLRDRDLRLGLKTAVGFAGLYDAPTIERIDTRNREQHPILRALGPDLLSPTFNADLAVSRAPPSMPVGLALLDQTIAAGIGNVYRAEALFYARANPHTPVASLVDPAAPWRHAARLMTANLEPGRSMQTRTGWPEHWVYGRFRKPCLRCGRRVRREQLGGWGRDGAEQLTRSVYWCDVCQTR